MRKRERKTPFALQGIFSAFLRSFRKIKSFLHSLDFHRGIAVEGRSALLERPTHYRVNHGHWKSEGSLQAEA